MNRIKVSVVGCGYWGKNFVRTLSELKNLSSICEVNEHHAANISKQYNVPILSFDQIIDSDVTAIIISVPPTQHYEFARKALEAGKHVLVEKPFTMNLAEACILHDIAFQTKKVLMVGHLLQYHPAFLKMKQLINENKLGRIHNIYAHRLNLGNFRHKENVLWDLVPHDISLILSLTNNLPEKIYTRGNCNYNPLIHDTILTDLSFSNDIKAHIFVSWAHPFKEQKFVVIGERGMAVFDDCLPWAEKLKICFHEINYINGIVHYSKQDIQKVFLEEAEPLKLECQHFIKCIENNEQPKTNSFEGIQVVKVLDAITTRLAH